jgi:hypothetical protein
MIGAVGNARNGKGLWSEFPCMIHRFTDRLANSFRADEASRKGPTAATKPIPMPKTAQNTTPPTRMKNTQLIVAHVASSESKL